MRTPFGLFLFLTLVHPVAAQLHFPHPAVDWSEMKRGPVRVQPEAFRIAADQRNSSGRSSLR